MNEENKFQNLDIASQEQQEGIKKIELLKIGNAQKADVILVILGVKPATEVSVFEWNDSPDEVKHILLESGLVVVEKEVNGKEIAQFAVAKNEDNARKLALFDPSKDHGEYGRLMGFPESAVVGFVQEKCLDRDKYPDLNSIVFNFALSEDEWKNEVKLLKYWSELLKKYSPTIYEELLRNNSIGS